MSEIPSEVTFSDVNDVLKSAGPDQIIVGPGTGTNDGLSITDLKDAFTEWARYEGILGTLDQAAIAGEAPPLVLKAFLAGALAMANGNGKAH